jgi:hypothetical protein
MVKKIAFALAAIGISSAAFAGHPGDAVVAPTGVNLIAPDSVGVWTVGLEALYMEPTNSDFQYAQVNDNSLPTNTFHNKSTNSTHDWGGTIDVDYMFPGNSRDVKLSYTHLHMDDNSGSVSTVGTGSSLNEPFGVSPQNFDGARGSSDNDLDAVDLVFGQWIRIGERVDLHPFGGLRYASIDMNDKGTYSDSTDETNYGVGKIKSDFSGIGPRAGLDAAVHVGSGVSFVGTVGASLLIGSTDSKMSATEYTADVATDGYSLKNGEGTHVIPELDARLGVNYTYNFDPATALGVELGYQAVNYFDVADKDFIDAAVPNTVNNSEDFGYHGPYLRV